MSSEQTGHADEGAFTIDVQAVIGALKTGDFATLIPMAQTAVEDAPEQPIGYALFAIVAELSQERARAIEMLVKAHEIDPDCREYALALATLYTYVGKLADGLYFFKLSEVLASDPVAKRIIPVHMLDYATAMANIQGSPHYIDAMRAYNVSQYDLCVDQCMRELRHTPSHQESSELLGRALLKTGRPGRAVSAFQTAVHLKPSDAAAYAGLGTALMNLGQFTDAEACFDRAVAMAPDNAAVVCRAQLGKARLPGADAAVVDGPLGRWRDAMREDLELSKGDAKGSQGGGLRVGMVSDSFYASALQPYFGHLIDAANRMGVEVRLYTKGKAMDATSARMQNAAAAWREITDIDEFTLAETIRREELDVLIDLCFEPETQAMELFAAGAAPVQLSFFGRPEASGVPGMTHVLSDSWTGGADEASRVEGQVLLTPTEGFICREPYLAYEELTPSQVAETGHLVFGMRADPAGITPDDAFAVIDVLHAVPGSSVLLGLTPRLDEETRNRLVELFAYGGVVDRVAFEELPGSHDQQVMYEDIATSFFRDVDVFLVPSSHVQFDDVALSLWMGVPAVVHCGSTRMTRLSASALAQAGKAEWIADNREAFVSIARELADDVDRLSSLRETLRRDVSQSNLFNTQKVAINVWQSLAAVCKEK